MKQTDQRIQKAELHEQNRGARWAWHGRMKRNTHPGFAQGREQRVNISFVRCRYEGKGVAQAGGRCGLVSEFRDCMKASDASVLLTCL